jgi:hypothetical protein
MKRKLTSYEIDYAKGMVNIFERFVELKKQIRRAYKEGNVEFLQKNCRVPEFVKRLPKREE